MTNRSKADTLQPKPKRKQPTGKPFVKNDPATGAIDPRINRDGRLKPRVVRELEKLLDKIFDRDVKLNNGELITALEAMLTDMMHNKQSAGRIWLAERRFGKVPQAVDVTSGGEAFVMTIVKASDVVKLKEPTPKPEQTEPDNADSNQ